MRLVARIVASVVSLVAAVSTGVAPATAAEPAVVIWADPAVAPAVRQAVSAVGGTVTVVPVRETELAQRLADASALSAPDLIWLPNALTGALAARGLIQRLPLGPALRERFPAQVLDGFRYGFAYYGLPVRYSNVALIVNTDLAGSIPATFSALERRGLRLVADGRADLPLAVGLGSSPDGAALFPLLTGLGGYLFGRNAAGSLDPYNVGIACTRFLDNADRIDEWNDSGLLSSKVDAAGARQAFLDGRAPYWIAAPAAAEALDRVDFEYEIGPIPPIVDGFAPAPALDVEGVALTSFASTRGTLDRALTLVRRVFTRADVQSAIAAAGGLPPARVDASAGDRARDFARAGAAGVAAPNIVQADALWPLLDAAWSSATGGPSATRARSAFTAAQRAAVAAVG